MQIYCPYCQSGNIIRSISQSQVQGQSGHSNTGLASSASFAAIGVSLSKTLPLPVPPVIGGLAGMVVGGLLGSLFDEPAKPIQSISYRYFHCEDCQRDFH